MATLKILSLNGKDMTDLVPADGSSLDPEGEHHWRAKLLASLVRGVDPDVVGLVEAPPDAERTKAFVDRYLGGAYDVHQGEKRGLLGLVVLVRSSLGISAAPRTKDESKGDFPLGAYDADNDGIRELYDWFDRVPYEVELSGGGLEAPTRIILIHAKSKGAFVPGDLYAYERVSRANRMKQRAQARAVRKRLNQIIGEDGAGRVIVMGDLNDGPEFDQYAALLGGSFLEPIMGSVWDPVRTLYNPHFGIDEDDRWTIDFLDRVVNPLEASRYGSPTELRSWIDHILFSPELKPHVDEASAGILHHPDRPDDLPDRFRRLRATDHHPPFVSADL